MQSQTFRECRELSVQLQMQTKQTNSLSCSLLDFSTGWMFQAFNSFKSWNDSPGLIVPELLLMMMPLWFLIGFRKSSICRHSRVASALNRNRTNLTGQCTFHMRIVHSVVSNWILEVKSLILTHEFYVAVGLCSTHVSCIEPFNFNNRLKPRGGVPFKFQLQLPGIPHHCPKLQNQI